MPVWRQFKHSVKVLARRAARMKMGSPSAAPLALALGIGATTAIFAVIDGVLIQPQPYPH